MKDSIIKPKYSFKSLWDVILLSLGLAFVIIFSATRLGFGLETLSLLILLIGFFFWWAHFLIRSITFGKSSFIVVPYILSPKVINYVDVIDIGATKIKTRNGTFHFVGVTNVDEILGKFQDVASQGKIHRHKLENKIKTEEAIWRKSMLPSLAISLPLLVLAYHFWSFDDMWFSSVGFGVVSGLILFFVISAVQWMVKRKRKKNKQPIS